MAGSTLENTERIVRLMGEVAIGNREYFCELDGVVGDGDFGTSLATGFETVTGAKWADLNRSNSGAFLKDVAMTIMSNVGGATGTLWGTAFLRAGATAGDKEELTAADAVAMLRAAAEGMKKRGKSDLGDKTLLDAFIPATDEFESVLQDGGSALDALRSAALSARRQCEETKPWVAKRGRASYSGERSCDTYDAGAVAVAMMAEKIVEAWPQ